MSEPELLQVVEPDLDSVTDETLHMIIALDDFGLRPSLEMSQVICRRLIRAERQVADLIRQRDEAWAEAKKAKQDYEDLYELDEETWVAEAEARGYERGVREAASILDFSPACAAKQRAILALLEKEKTDER
jgi:hypothetical protein